MTALFKDLEPQAIFWVWGDIYGICDWAKWCMCVKIGEYTAQEVGGKKFHINPNDEVHI